MRTPLNREEKASIALSSRILKIHVWEGELEPGSRPRKSRNVIIRYRKKTISFWKQVRSGCEGQRLQKLYPDCFSFLKNRKQSYQLRIKMGEGVLSLRREDNVRYVLLRE